jgi:hypothetical protein
MALVDQRILGSDEIERVAGRDGARVRGFSRLGELRVPSYLKVVGRSFPHRVKFFFERAAGIPILPLFK